MVSSQSQDIIQHPWFPKTEPPLGGGALAGEWQQRTQNSLGIIAKSLVYQDTKSRINSLPSPWSRALQFEQAVLNSRYPTREALLEELFGGLACIGLWDMFGRRLVAERVSLKEYIIVQDLAVGPFSRSLSSALPEEQSSLSVHTDRHPWDTIYIFQLEDVVIGFSSPTTLFCPTVHLPKPIEGMGWTAGGRFKSPVTFLSVPQKQALADWFGHVRTGITSAPDLQNQNTASQLAEVLGGFIQNLISGQLGNPTLSDTARVQNLPPRPTALALLSRPAKGGVSESLATLDLGDRIRRPLTEVSTRPIILVDPDMPIKLGKPPAEVYLYKTATIEAIAYDPSRLVSQYGGEISVLTPDSIFLEEMYLLPGKQMLSNSWLAGRLEGEPVVNGEPVTPLLPLKPEVRNLFSSRELRERCELRVVQSTVGLEIEVRLSLPLRGLRDGYPISRSYPLKEENLIDQDIPVITVWPYVSDENWKLFYLFCDDNPTGLCIDGFSDYSDRKSGQYGGQSVKYFTTSSFPDLVRLNERGQDCGLLPVEPPPATPSQSETWQVGIDFGTSFTNFYVDSGDGPKRMHLDTRVKSLTLSEKESRRQRLNQYFIPEEMFPNEENGGNPPTATAISVRGWALADQPGEVPQLFHEARLRVPTPNEFGGAELRTGFKWHQSQYQEPFLKELALLISANAAAGGARQINWAVSYPSAFSPNEVARYQRVWVDLCEKLTPLTGISHLLNEQAGEAGLQTEAVAFASYFGNFQARQMVHTSCLDIGGGTTDISIWQENRLIHQSSVPYAGKDISSKLLQRKPSFLKALFPSSLTAEINDDEMRARQDKNFTSRLDNIMRYGSEALLSGRLDRLANQSSPIQRPLQEFLSLVAVSFGGLYHYLGKVHYVLRQEGKLSRMTPTPVYVGGNGGRLLNWIDASSRLQVNGELDRLLEMVQIQASQCNSGRANTTLSGAFKDETACGLISKGVNLLGDFDPRNDAMISGSAMRINNLLFNEGDRVVIPSNVTKVVKVEMNDTSALKEFVSSYDAILAELRISNLLKVSQLCDIDSLWDDVEKQVSSLCHDKLGRTGEVDVSEFESEPGFILGLRALTNSLSTLWADRF